MQEWPKVRDQTWLSSWQFFKLGSQVVRHLSDHWLV